MKKILTMTALVTITTASFGAASLKAPQRIGNTATVTAPSTTARAGTLRTPTMKTSSVSTPSVTTTQIATEPTESRIALLKGAKGLNPGKIKDTKNAQQELKVIDTRIEELQSKLDQAEAIQHTVLKEENINDKITTSVESKTYTKAEIDDMLSDVIKKLPQLDDKGNMTWTDPNGNLAVIHIGDVVIGGDDTIIIDGNLSTTSTHPVQNKVVTNALNEKQDKSTTVSFGAANGRWTPLTNSNYLESYTNIDGAGFDIKQNMIVNNLDNIANENQLVTATAVKNALDAMTTNPGGGTQGNNFYLQNMNTRYDSLVTKYWYFAPGITTTDQEGELQILIRDTICDGVFSEKWCFYQTEAFQDGGILFSVTKRNMGHYLEDYNLSYYWDNGVLTTQLTKRYILNLPDDVGLITYVQGNLCTTRDTCSVNTVWYAFDSDQSTINANNELEGIYMIDVVQTFVQ